MSRITKHKLKKSVERRTPKKSIMSKKMLWTLIIGGLMVASVFGIMFSSYNSAREEMTFGDYEFVQTRTGWATEINGRMHEFSYLPSDVEELNISEDVSERLKDLKVVYITFNPNSDMVQQMELMRFELGRAFAEIFGIYSMPGITEENEQYNQTLITCENATVSTPVINIVEANLTNAYVGGNCIVLEPNEYSAMALKDWVLYSMLGII